MDKIDFIYRVIASNDPEKPYQCNVIKRRNEIPEKIVTLADFKYKSVATQWGIKQVKLNADAWRKEQRRKK